MNDVELHRTRLAQQLRASNGALPMLPDGPLLESFSALELAQAIEWETNRAASQRLMKIRLDMDLENALRLAAYLRRAVGAGV